MLLKNIIKLTTGTSIGQFIPILISPLLTRLYSAEEFGQLALFISISTIIGTISNGKYELAIVLPKNDKDAANLAFLGLTLALATSLIAEVLFLIIDHTEIDFYNLASLSHWLLLVPILIWLIGTYNVLNYFFTRFSAYTHLSVSQVYKALATAVVSIGLGVIHVGAIGLIAGTITGYLVLNLSLITGLKSHRPLIDSISRQQIKILAKRYIRFPKYSTWAVLANSMSWDLTNILVAYFFSSTLLGYYSLAFRILMMPSNLIGNTIRQVLFQDISKKFETKNYQILKMFDKISMRLVLFSCSIFIPLYFIIEPLFGLIFGSEWVTAGVYAKLLIPLALSRFIVSPLGVVMNVFEKQNIALAVQLGMLLFSVFSFAIAYHLNFQIEQFITIFSWVLFGYYTLYFFICRQICSVKSLNNFHE